MLTQYLEKYFGHKDFLPGQKKIIDLICQGQNTLVVMPTGGGKSLCYQLPALLRHGTALVVSPLIALMKDQYDSLVKSNYPATFINSSLSLEEATERLSAAKNNQYKLIYIAPEKLTNNYFLKALANIQISFVAIDEAHCISEWGHDFRPAYLTIVQALKSISVSHIVALTATATPDVRQDIINTLQMQNPNIIVEGFDRANLNYFTEYTADKNQKLIEILLKNKAQQGSTIIYCGTRKQTETIHNLIATNPSLMQKGITVTYYHGGLPDDTRHQNQDKFISGEAKVIVATNAFGMGIDKPDVRNVIHVSLPSSVEAYYQEAGRAGRDSLPANCYLLYNYEDGKLGKWFIERNFPAPADFEAVYNYLCAAPPLAISIEAITFATGIERHVAVQVLKYFAVQKIIEKNNSNKKTKISFHYAKNELQNILPNMPKDCQATLDALIRSYTDNQFFKQSDLNIDYISHKYNIPRAEITQSINHLAARQIISVTPEQPANTVNMIAPPKAFANLNIDFDKQARRKAWMQEKLNIMQTYATTNRCKRNFILEYFADPNRPDNCGRCSSCLSPAAPGLDLNLANLPADAIKVLSAAAELNGKFGRGTLVAYLLGRDHGHIKRYNLQRGEYYGSLKHLRDKGINHIIEALLFNDLLAITNATYPLLSATAAGLRCLPESVTPLLQHKTEYLQQSRATFGELALGKFLKEEIPPLKFLQTAKTRAKHFVKPVAKPAPLANIPHTLSSRLGDIDAFFRQGLTIDAVAKALGCAKGDVAAAVQMAVEQGHIVESWPYCSAALLAEVKSILLRYPGILLRDLQIKLQEPADVAMLRIVLSFARRELKG